MTKEEALKAIEKHGSQRAAALALRVHRTVIQRAINGRKSQAKTVCVEDVCVKHVRNLSDFKSQYDKSTIIPSKVKAALKVLGASGWVTEVEFAKMAGVSLSDLGNFRDAFSDHVVPLERGAKRAWAGSKKLADQMKELL